MKTTTTINLANTPFIIDSDAFQLLSDYLEKLHHHFDTTAESQEIINDIESRIAEHFLATGKSIINFQDVKEITDILGDPQQFGVDVPQESSESVRRNKQFFRNTDDTVIAGVASGLGCYFGIDPVLIRIAFIATVFVGGFGIVLYLILWLITPKAVTPSDRLAMQGDPITLSNIASMVQEKAKNGAVQENVTGFLREIIQKTGRFFEDKLLPMIRFVFGLGMVLSTLFFIIAGTVFLGVILFGIPVVLLEELSFITLYQGLFTATVIGGYVSVIIPLIILFFIGFGILKKKKVIQTGIMWVLFVIWCIGTIIGGIAGVRFAMNVINDEISVEQQELVVQNEY